MLQFALFPRVIECPGPGRVLLASIIAYVIIYNMFSFENLAARYATSTHGDETNSAIWLFVILQLALICITDMGSSEFLGKHIKTVSRVSDRKQKFKNRLGVYFHSCRRAKQAFAWCHERTSIDGSLHTTDGRPCSCSAIICLFVGEQCSRLGWELCLSCAACSCGRQYCRCCSIAEIYMEETQRLHVGLRLSQISWDPVR